MVRYMPSQYIQADTTISNSLDRLHENTNIDIDMKTLWSNAHLFYFVPVPWNVRNVYVNVLLEFPPELVKLRYIRQIPHFPRMCPHTLQFFL